MTPAEAYHILQLEPGAGREQIVQCYAEQTRVLKEKRAKAPSPGHKAHFQQGLARLTAAHDVLIQREDAAAGAARRRRGANQATQAGPAEVEAKAVTAADVDVAADRLPRRLNRHADGVFFALLATLAGGLVGALVFLLLVEDAGRRALVVGVGLVAGFVPGIFWWRATVQRLRREEWIQVREALERGETLPLAWRRQALRLAVALLLFLGFGAGYQRWTRWPALPLRDDREWVQAKGTGKPMSAAAESGGRSSNEGLTQKESDPRAREWLSPGRESTPAAAASRQASAPAGEAKSTASRAPVEGSDAPARKLSAATPAQRRDAEVSVPTKVAGLAGETRAAEQGNPLAVRGGGRAADRATTRGRPLRADQNSTMPADVIRAESARAAGGDPQEIRAGLAEAYQAWAEALREAEQPGLALFALDQAKAAGLADDDLAAALRKEFSEANALTVWLAPPQIIEAQAAVASDGAALKATAAELDHVLHETLASALPEVVTLQAAEAKTAEAAARGPWLVLRVEARASENATPASTDTLRETSDQTGPLPRALRASVRWVSRPGSGTAEEDITLLNLTAELRDGPDARATSLAEETEALAALKSDLVNQLHAGMPELLVKFAEATLAVMQARRAAAAGEGEDLPGDLEWGWFAVWAEAGLTLPQGDAELAARRALALPESQPVGENR